MNRYPHFFTKSSETGVTIIEMMVVIAIASILLATAAPSFQSTIFRWNVDALRDDFRNAVLTARTEATTRGEPVRICPIRGDGNVTCIDSTWRNGWVVITEDNVEVARFENRSGFPITVHDEDDDGVGVITFNAQGLNLEEVRYVFAVCAPNATTPSVRKGVTIELSGQAFKTLGPGENIHEVVFDDGNGGANNPGQLSCTQA